MLWKSKILKKYYQKLTILDYNLFPQNFVGGKFCQPETCTAGRIDKSIRTKTSGSRKIFKEFIYKALPWSEQ